MAAPQICIGTFTCRTGSTGTLDVTGIVDKDSNAFTPKAIRIWGTYQTATGYTDESHFSWGYADNAITQRGFCTRGNDNATPTDVRRARSTTSIISVVNIAGTALCTAAVSAIASGQFTLNFTAVDAAAVFHYIAFGGSELEAMVTTITSCTNPTSTPALDFAPKFVMQSSTFSSAGTWMLNEGWRAYDSDGNLNGQAAAYMLIEDANAASDVWRYQSAAQCYAIPSTNSGAVAATLVANTWGTAWSLSSADTTFDCLVLGGNIQAKVSSGSQPTSAQTQTITGVGFLPLVLGVVSVGNTTSAAVATEARFSFGLYDGRTQGLSWTGDLDGQNPEVSARRHVTDRIVTMSTPAATGSSSTTEAQASAGNFAADGFDLVWDIADGTAREYIWFALAEGTGGASPGDPTGMAWAPISTIQHRTVASGFASGR